MWKFISIFFFFFSSYVSTSNMFLSSSISGTVFVILTAEKIFRQWSPCIIITCTCNNFFIVDTTSTVTQEAAYSALKVCKLSWLKSDSVIHLFTKYGVKFASSLGGNISSMVWKHIKDIMRLSLGEVTELFIVYKIQ